MAKTYLLGSIGLPGSGKSTFLKRFASEQKFFYWQNDEARRHIFAHPDHTPAEHDILGHCAKYVFSQLLPLGLSCIYDVNLNRHRNRQALGLLGLSHGAEFRALWFQVPIEISRRRVKARGESADGEQKAYYDTFRPDLVDYMAKRL